MIGFVVATVAVGDAGDDPIRGPIRTLARHGEPTWVRVCAGAVCAGIGRRGADDRADASTPMVGADAALYYRADLVRALGASGGSVPADASAEQLIAAAYRAWGAGLASKLEGDFAFALYDETSRTLVCARDFVGRRPLYYARIQSGIVAASTLGAVLAHPSVRSELDPGVVAATAAGLFALREETAHREIRSLPPGHTLVWRDGTLSISAHWRAPPIEERMAVPGTNVEEGAERLRDLLTRAVSERLDPDRPTSVWLSGGWDSTAVFGAANLALSDGRAGGGLRPVSISYPPGDPGREDELIEATVRQWKTRTRWLDIADIPLLDRPASRAASRDEPFAHVFESWNLALARGSASDGCRIALDGVGGDQLFQLSMVTLSELARRGRWLSLRREWRAKRMRGWRNLLRWAVVPHLSRGTLAFMERIRCGSSPAAYLERPVAPWFRRDFLREHSVLERERANTPARSGLRPVSYETFWYLTHPFGGKILSTVSGLASEEGVEVRSPLMDARVVAFALSRPWPERSWGAETKVVLRRAVRGAVPDEVLAPRRYRTGTTSRYLVESLAAAGGELIEPMLRPGQLAELGIVDPAELNAGWQRFLRTKDENLAVALLLTLHAELWLAERNGAHG